MNKRALLNENERVYYIIFAMFLKMRFSNYLIITLLSI